MEKNTFYQDFYNFPGNEGLTIVELHLKLVFIVIYFDKLYKNTELNSQ